MIRKFSLLFLLALAPFLPASAQPVPDHLWSSDGTCAVFGDDVLWDRLGGMGDALHAVHTGGPPRCGTQALFASSGLVLSDTTIGYEQGPTVGRLVAQAARFDTVFTYGGWYRQDGTQTYIASSWDWQAGERSWALVYDGSNGFKATVSPDGSSTLQQETAPIASGANTGWKLVWFYANPATGEVGIAQGGGAWTTLALGDTLHPGSGAIDIAGNASSSGAGVRLNSAGLWFGEVLSAAERQAIANAGVGGFAGVYGVDVFEPPVAFPFESLTVVADTFITEQQLIDAGHGKGTFWWMPYPIYEWDPALAADSGAFLVARGSDHADDVEDGIYVGSTDSKTGKPDLWHKVISPFTDSDGNDWVQPETPWLSYHPDDPDGKPYYLHYHAVNTAGGGSYGQATRMRKSADPTVFDISTDTLQLDGRLYADNWLNPGDKHTGYFNFVQLDDGTYRGQSSLKGGKFSVAGVWESPDARDWTLIDSVNVSPIGVLAPHGHSLNARAYFRWGEDWYSLWTTGYSNQNYDLLRVTRVGEVEDGIGPEGRTQEGKPLAPTIGIHANDWTGTSNGWMQNVTAYQEADTLDIWIKYRYQDPAHLQHLRAVLKEPPVTVPDTIAVTVDGQPRIYNRACYDDPAGRTLVGSLAYPLTLGTSADSTQRAANSTAINAALAAAPEGGSTCLPEGDVALTWDIATGFFRNAHIRFSRDNVDLVGAGACGWGAMSGCTRIHTPGDSLYATTDGDSDGILSYWRGNAVNIFHDVAPGDTIKNISIKGIHFATGLPWNGNDSYNLEAEGDAALNGWDLNNNAIRITGGADPVDGILIEDVRASGYRGEVIYNGGAVTGAVTVRRFWASASNGSAFNIATASPLLVEDSQFGDASAGDAGRVRFWAEVLAEHKDDLTAVFRRNTYEGCATGDGCIAVAFDDAQNAATGQSWTWEDNTFDCTGPDGADRAAFLTEGGPYKLTIRGNTFTDCRLAIVNGAGTDSTLILGNTLSQAGGNLFVLQGGGFPGRIAGNTFTGTSGPSLYSVSGGDHGALVVEGNTFVDYTSPTQGGNGPSVWPRSAGNVWTGHTPSLTSMFGSGKQQPLYEYLRIQSGSGTPYALTLNTKSADGQQVQVIGAGSATLTLLANSVQHAWAEDQLLAPGDTLDVIFDRQALTWSLYEGTPPAGPAELVLEAVLAADSVAIDTSNAAQPVLRGAGAGTVPSFSLSQPGAWARRATVLADGDTLVTLVRSITPPAGDQWQLYAGAGWRVVERGGSAELRAVKHYGGMASLLRTGYDALRPKSPDYAGPASVRVLREGDTVHAAIRPEGASSWTPLGSLAMCAGNPGCIIDAGLWFSPRSDRQGNARFERE